MLDSKESLPSFVYELFLWYHWNHGGVVDLFLMAPHFLG
jgi:hypothetical protein